MAGLLRSMAVLAVLLLAGLGCLFVLDVIPRETLQELSVKGIAIVGILGAAALAVALLVKRPGP